MRLLPFALLAALPLASPLAAQGIVVEPGAIAPGHTVAVSWRVPAGFVESELLVVLDGGPRVRLTDEFREERPRAVVRVPAVVGRARFLVRAGRKNAAGRHEEIDLATSEWFSLSFAPVAGPVPVRAPSTRPDSGEATEWWSQPAAGRTPDGPSPGIDAPNATDGPDGTASPAALPPDRTDAGPGSPRTIAGFLEERQAAPRPPGPRVLDRPFPGAPVPLRN